MTTPPTRALLRAALATLALSTVTLGGASAAFAAPGDNGDVKVHRENTPDNSQANEPQVGCTFKFSAFNFVGVPTVQWNIVAQPSRPGDPSFGNGSITLDATGYGFTGPVSGVPSGMYKVEWTWANMNGAPKSKVFRVHCPDGPNNNGGNNNGGNGNGGGHGHGRPPHGPVGAGGGGSAQLAAEDSSAFGVGAAVAAGLAGTAGLVLIRRSRRRAHGAA
ncbi:hypothetical protein GCM10010275_60980 [Streptomyces litmocidini]|uniref:hypothetical protein n=1 Tax=Streptomyces litmocidini TaxID=67318 RepID=UPI00167E9E92|nr:hypothetical protein [Streptomyces litmocidini]GGV11829.1 hypothetical protein GCM10010275_60980 [Streptomyces litmocidini]